METGNKKPSVTLFVLGSITAVYVGYMVGGVWEEGMVVTTFLPAFLAIWEKPFSNYWGMYSIRCIVAVWSLYVLIMIIYYTSKRNLLPGKEYGTARFENPKRVDKILKDTDDSYNRILSRNIRMSLDFRRLKLNGNILICGGSGSGKTFYEVKPNLMAMPKKCSFVCTDPKGEILRSCGQMLKDSGYQIKVINLLEMEKSDCYNPFAYIREETDVVKGL